MSKGKEKDLSTDWSEYIWDDGGYWYSTRKDPSGEDEYDYQYPETTEGIQQRERTPRTPGPNILSTNESSEQSHLDATSSNEFHETTTLDTDRHYSHSTETIVPTIRDLPADETSIGQQASPSLLTAPTFILSPTTTTAPELPQNQYPDGSLYPSSAGPSTLTGLAYNIEARGFGNHDTTPDNLVSNIQSLSLRDTQDHGLYAPPQSEWQSGQPQQPKHIRPASGGQTYETLDPRYCIVPESKQKSFWKVGRVFMMLWTEIARPRREGETRNGTHFSTVYLGGEVYSEIRRFVVMKDGWGSCICSPIQTYGKQATLKPNLPEPSQHTIIYTGNEVPDVKWYPVEGGQVVRERLTKTPIQVVREQTDKEGQLDPASRLNYSKVYTVEKYVRVLNIGMVHQNSMASLERSSFIWRNDLPERPQSHRPRSGSGGNSGGNSGGGNSRRRSGGSHPKQSSGGGSDSRKPRDNTKDSRRHGPKKN